MESLVPDIDYYQMIVNNSQANYFDKEYLAYELQSLINEVKVYMDFLQKKSSDKDDWLAYNLTEGICRNARKSLTNKTVPIGPPPSPKPPVPGRY